MVVVDCPRKRPRSGVVATTMNRSRPSSLVAAVAASVSQKRRRRTTSSSTLSLWQFRVLVVLVVVVVAAWTTTCKASAAAAQQQGKDDNASSTATFPPDFLTEESVVLITGAAGFLGSELALALHRTYEVKRIICVDRMVEKPQTQDELSLFEFQRQRAFHVLQTIGNRAVFYRADFAPMIPEYFDLGEVPVLDHIFREHPDITHVVHLADPYPHSALQVVPREKDVPKAGMMEALMEQLVKQRRDNPERRLPHFTYASSSEVYPYAVNQNHNNRNDNLDGQPLVETQPLSTPASLRGASKMIDEMLAKLYFDTRGLYSVGLRFFSVYGPWGVPGSTIFEMAERAVTGNLANDGDDNHDDVTSPSTTTKTNIQDYVYIDDAIDAVMAAMQFRPAGEKPHPVIFNVASGEGHSPQDVASIMQEFFPPKTTTNSKHQGQQPGSTGAGSTKGTVSIGSIERAKTYLRYQPRVSLREGIINLLAWHYDRAFPYGGRKQSAIRSIEGIIEGTAADSVEKRNMIASRGIESCLPYDKECLRAAPVFPCASECSHETQCTKSYYDEIIGWTQALTSECETVLYTADLDDSLASIPSAHLQFQSTSKSFLNGNCNLAFVSGQSKLVQSLRRSSRTLFMGSTKDKVLRHGAWILIPVTVPTFTEYTAENDVLKLLPKLSPGLFFGTATKRAIYVEPNILLDSIPKLLREASTQPYNEEMEGATAMLIGRGTPKNYFSHEADDDFLEEQVMQSTATLVQNSAYRMVRIAVSDKLFGDGFMELLDSRWMVHTLQSDDARLFRCDVLGEVVQWGVSTDRSALEFVLGLHDMWSRVIAKSSGLGPWWIGDGVVTVPERHIMRRRLQEETDVGETKLVEVEAIAGEVVNEDGETEEQENAEQLHEDESAGLEEAEGDTLDAVDVDQVGSEDEEDDEGAEEEEEEAIDDDNINDSDEEEEEEEGGAAVEQGALVLDAGAQQEVAADEEKRGDSDEDEEEEEGRQREADEGTGRDFSSYDTWMGILSSSRIKYFVRIVPSSEVGVVTIDQ